MPHSLYFGSIFAKNGDFALLDKHTRCSRASCVVGPRTFLLRALETGSFLGAAVVTLQFERALLMY